MKGARVLLQVIIKKYLILNKIWEKLKNLKNNVFE